MADEQRQEQVEEEIEVESKGQLVRLQAGEPVVPKGLSEEQAAEARRQASALVTQLMKETGSAELRALDEVTNVGTQVQREAADQLGSLKSRVSEYLRDGGAGKEIATGLGDLRRALEQINPHSPATSGPWDRIASRLPFLPSQINPVRALQRISMRYEPVSVHIAGIESSLREGRGMLVREVHFQYFVSIEMSRQINNRLGQAVERTLTLATNVITVGLAIQAALVRQRSVMEATTRNREFLGDVVTANAAAIKRHTEEIGDLYKNPVIAVEKITKAHDDLLEALNMASKLRAEGIENANDNIARLARLSNEMQTKVLGLPHEDDGALEGCDDQAGEEEAEEEKGTRDS